MAARFADERRFCGIGAGIFSRFSPPLCKDE
jgi:hypothetical protein